MQVIKIRKAKKEDINFVYSAWLRCYSNNSPITQRYVRKESQKKEDFEQARANFFDTHQKILDTLLSKDNMEVLIACDDQDEDLIYGFSALEPGIIHFVYVKQPFRKMGIGTKLLSTIDLNHCKTSHLTYGLIEMWLAGKMRKCEYAPHLLGV